MPIATTLDSPPTTSKSVSDPREPTARALYLGMNEERSIAEVARRLNMSRSTLQKWKKDCDWDRHAAEYDARRAQAIAQHSTDRLIKAWQDSIEVQLQVAAMLRAKAAEYIHGRGLEGVQDHNGNWVIKGMDPQKARVALDFLKESNNIERYLLDPRERADLQAATQGITSEQLQAQIARGMKEIEDFKRALPQESGPDDMLGEYGV